MNQAQIAAALDLIAATPGFDADAAALRRTRIRFQADLPDRAQTSLSGQITLGPEPFAGTDPDLTVSLAGTLVHEHVHTRQNPFLKTVSFWHGIASRQHPMRLYERPAYVRQWTFLQTLAEHDPLRHLTALAEAEFVAASFAAHYSAPGDDLEH